MKNGQLRYLRPELKTTGRGHGLPLGLARKKFQKNHQSQRAAAIMKQTVLCFRWKGKLGRRELDNMYLD